MNPASEDPNDRYSPEEMWWPWGNPYAKPEGTQTADPGTTDSTDAASEARRNDADAQEFRYNAMRALRWIDLHQRTPPPNRLPIEDDPDALSRLMSNIIREMRERDQRRQE